MRSKTTVTSAAGRRVVACVAGAAVTLGGCAHDCDEKYCDIVRAGATGWFAHELQCCRRPDTPGCDQREAQLLEFNLLAMEMRSACEAANWDRFRELWNDGWRLLPPIVPFLVADEFCDGWDWSGRNTWAPFDPDDWVAASVVLDPSAPRLRIGRAGGTGPGVADVAVPTIERHWTIRPGAMVSIEAFGVEAGFAAHGSLTVVETLENPDIQPGDDIESWCRRMKPRGLVLDLENGAGAITLRLDPRFEGSQVRFDHPDGGVIGLGVSIEAVMDWPGSAPLDVAIESAFVELPFSIGSDGTMTLLPDGAASMLDLMPVDPAVEAWIRGEDPLGAAGGETDACISQARAVAESYLALHPQCAGTGP